MSTNFPASLDTLTNPAPLDGLTGHAAQHSNENDAIEALQAKVGVDGSAVASSLDYRVAALEAGSGGGSWGSITGTLSDQADLQAALNGKLPTGSTTDAVAEGAANLYFTAQRVRDVVLTGLSTATNAVITATDTVLGALGKLQKQITDNLSTLTTHTGNTSNPHSVTKAQVGLGSVDNTADADKPVSTATAAALDLKAPKASPTFTGPVTISQYLNVTQSYGALQVGGVDVMRFGSDRSGQLAGFRNKVINGGCAVAQRGTVAAANNVWTYGGCDRIAVGPAGFTSLSGTIQQAPDTDVYGQYSQTATLTSTGAGTVAFQTRLEAKDVACLNRKTVTFSAYVWQNTGAATNALVQVLKANSSDTFTEQTLLASSSIESVPNGGVKRITGSVTLGAQDASNGLALSIVFQGVGAVSSKTFSCWNLQLEEGSIATSFENRPYGLELALCQRYWESSYYTGTAPGSDSESGLRIRTTRSTPITGGGYPYGVHG